LLIFVGLGLDSSLSSQAIKALEECDEVFYEDYTSPPAVPNAEERISSQISGKPVRKVDRDFVESGSGILKVAASGHAALLSPGDPMIATTHEELRTRASRQGIATKILHGASILSALPGELGLHSYNFGRCVTVTSGPLQHTAYNTVYANLLQGLHSALLLEWDSSRKFFLSPRTAIDSLLASEKDIQYGVFGQETLVLAASRIGRGDSAIQAAKLDEFQRLELGDPPHVLVIPGRFHLTEREALGALTNKEPGWFPDNSSMVRRLSATMVDRYTKKTEAALERAREAAKKKGVRFADVFENVEAYAKDSVRFMAEGKEELAVLSIGYAEGLLDSLRFAGLLEFEW
jgi:diphthine synthase